MIEEWLQDLVLDLQLNESSRILKDEVKDTTLLQMFQDSNYTSGQLASSEHQLSPNEEPFQYPHIEVENEEEQDGSHSNKDDEVALKQASNPPLALGKRDGSASVQVPASHFQPRFSTDKRGAERLNMTMDQDKKHL